MSQENARSPVRSWHISFACPLGHQGNGRSFGTGVFGQTPRVVEVNFRFDLLTTTAL